MHLNAILLVVSIVIDARFDADSDAVGAVMVALQAVIACLLVATLGFLVREVQSQKGGWAAMAGDVKSSFKKPTSVGGGSTGNEV